MGKTIIISLLLTVLLVCGCKTAEKQEVSATYIELSKWGHLVWYNVAAIKTCIEEIKQDERYSSSGTFNVNGQEYYFAVLHVGFGIICTAIHIYKKMDDMLVEVAFTSIFDPPKDITGITTEVDNLLRCVILKDRELGVFGYLPFDLLLQEEDINQMENENEWKDCLLKLAV